MNAQTDITTNMQAIEALPLENHSLSANEVLADSSDTLHLFVP